MARGFFSSVEFQLKQYAAGQMIQFVDNMNVFPYVDIFDDLLISFLKKVFPDSEKYKDLNEQKSL